MINPYYLSFNDLGGRSSRAGIMGVRVDELYQVNGGPVAHNPGHRMLIWVDMKA